MRVAATAIGTSGATAPPEVREYREPDRAGLVALWARHFGAWSARRLEQRWAWQFEQNPFARERAPRILLGVVPGEERVVGHVSAVPVPLRVNGVSRMAHLASGLVAEEGYRLLGFALLRQFLAGAPVIASGMHPSVMKIVTASGLPILALSRKRYTLELRSAGRRCRELRKRLRAWAAPALTPRLVGLMPAGGNGVHREKFRAGAEDIREIARFDAEYEGVWGRFAPSALNCIEKTAAYMNWRYVECPTQRAVRLGVYDGGRLAGVAVGVVRTELDWTRRPCVRFGCITEVIVEPGRETLGGALLRAMVREFDRQRVDAVTSLGLRPLLTPLLIELGLREETTDDFAMAVGLPRGEGLDTGDAAWYTGAGDGDVLYAATL